MNLLADQQTAEGVSTWLSRDPIGERGGLNLYGYVGNDPVNTIDSTGLWYITVGGGYFIGGKTTIGYNGGQWSWGLFVGIGTGLFASWDPKNSGQTHCPGTEHGVEAEGDIGVGGHVTGKAHIGSLTDVNANSWEVGVGLPGTPVGGTIGSEGANAPTFGVGGGGVVGVGGVHYYTPSSSSAGTSK